MAGLIGRAAPVVAREPNGSVMILVRLLLSHLDVWVGVAMRLGLVDCRRSLPNTEDPNLPTCDALPTSNSGNHSAAARLP